VIYRIIIGLVVVWTVATWSFFAGGKGYDGAIILVVTFFALMTVLIPLTLARIQRHHPVGRKGQLHETLRDWLGGEIDTWQERISGRDAAIMILLPVGVAAAGAIAFTIVFYVTLAGR